ncbi:MAG: hypothetical protein ABI461_09175 [Polyangiaceae bacterium]
MDKRVTKKTGTHSRRFHFAILACFSLPILMVVACTETERSLGERCLKGEDCTSGVCVAQQCAAAPPILQNTPTTPNDAAPDVTTAPVDAAEAGPVIDSGSDAPSTDADDASGD